VKQERREKETRRVNTIPEQKEKKGGLRRRKKNPKTGIKVRGKKGGKKRKSPFSGGRNQTEGCATAYREGGDEQLKPEVRNGARHISSQHEGARARL